MLTTLWNRLSPQNKAAVVCFSAALGIASIGFKTNLQGLRAAFMSWKAHGKNSNIGKSPQGFTIAALEAHQPISRSPTKFFNLSKFSKFTGATNDELVDNLLRYNILKTPRIAQAMKETDRALFVPDQELSYIDSPAPLGFGATCSAPHMHAYALELLSDHLRKPGCKVLDVGSGSGFLSVVFARLVASSSSSAAERKEDAPKGLVIGIDHIPELVQTSIRNVKKNPSAEELLSNGILQLRVGDGWQGCPEEAPFDAIHVGAAAATLPNALVDQLKPNGRMIIPLGPEGEEQKLAVIERDSEGRVTRRDAMAVVYVPLTSKERQLKVLGS